MNFKALTLSALSVIALFPGAGEASTWSRYTPHSFANEANQVNWGQPGNTYTFSYLNSCQVLEDLEFDRNPAELQALKDELNTLNQWFISEAKKNGMDVESFKMNLWMSDDFGFFPSDYVEIAREKHDRILELDDLIQVELRKSPAVTSRTPEGYTCSGGYVRWSNPQGTRTCEVDHITNRNGQWSFKSENCVWTF